MNNYFNLGIQESFPGEWQEYLDDVEPKYHHALTAAMSSLHYEYGDKAYKNTDAWFNILLGLIFDQESILQPSDAEYVYRVVDAEGNFAKPVSTGWRAPVKPNERRWSHAKGLYTTHTRAKAAIRGGVGSRVQRAEIKGWEDID